MGEQPASERTDDEITEMLEAEFVGKEITGIYFNRGFDHDTLVVEIDDRAIYAMGPEIHPMRLGGPTSEGIKERAQKLAKEHGW